MIGSLTGFVKNKKPNMVLIEVNGIGYEVNIPLSTSFKVPAINEPTSILTHLIVREDQHTLYGFATEDERNLFRALIKISGVGPKLALTILSGINTNDFIKSVTTEDIDTLIHLPGIGKKTAERLVVEMKDKVSEISDSLQISGKESLISNTVREAHNALTNLGYKSTEAKKILDKIDKDDLTVENLLKQALRSLNK